MIRFASIDGFLWVWTFFFKNKFGNLKKMLYEKVTRIVSGTQFVQ